VKNGSFLLCYTLVYRYTCDGNDENILTPEEIINNSAIYPK